MQEEKLMRTVRCRNDQKPGTLGHLLIAIAEAGGDVGEIRLIQETSQVTIRDITIRADDDAQLERILGAIASNPGTHILAVRDEVLELHQKRKIAIRTPLYTRFSADPAPRVHPRCRQRVHEDRC